MAIGNIPCWRFHHSPFKSFPPAVAPLSLLQGYPVLHHIISWTPASILQNRVLQQHFLWMPWPICLSSSLQKASTTWRNLTSARSIVWGWDSRSPLCCPVSYCEEMSPPAGWPTLNPLQSLLPAPRSHLTPLLRSPFSPYTQFPL